MNVTRCPFCETAFRVSDAQLAAAGGAVRCGACLRIFTATDHLVQEATADDRVSSREPADETAEPGAPPKPITRLPWVDDPAWAWITAMGATSGEISRQLDEALSPSMLDSADLPVPAPASEAMAEPPEADAEAEAESEVPVSTSDAALEEDHDLQDQQEKLAALQEEDQVVSEASEAEDTAAPDEEPDDAVAPTLEVEPLDTFDLVEQPVRRPQLRWWFASLLLLVFAGAQVLWFERDRFALDPRYRDAYEALCERVGCELPDYYEPRALGITQLVIRNHPSRTEALRVDALLRNDARFRQPFPPLRLRFADLRDRRVAERVFAPAEYLAGEMAGLKYIPGNTEVRVSFDVVDPGEDAVSYSMEIL